MNEWLGVDPRAYSGVPALRREARSLKRDDCENATGLKRGDLLEIVLIQTKGGSAPRPTAEEILSSSLLRSSWRRPGAAIRRRGAGAVGFCLAFRYWRLRTIPGPWPGGFSKRDRYPSKQRSSRCILASLQCTGWNTW
jgi:hypothetical protein